MFLRSEASVRFERSSRRPRSIKRRQPTLVLPVAGSTVKSIADEI
jgi:hypothetical protein